MSCRTNRYYLNFIISLSSSPISLASWIHKKRHAGYKYDFIYTIAFIEIHKQEMRKNRNKPSHKNANKTGCFARTHTIGFKFKCKATWGRNMGFHFPIPLCDQNWFLMRNKSSCGTAYRTRNWFQIETRGPVYNQYHGLVLSTTYFVFHRFFFPRIDLQQGWRKLYSYFHHLFLERISFF